MRFPAIILVPVLALSLSAARAAGLPDTGQDKCYDGASMVTCTSANTGDAAAYPRQDGRFGRDASNTAGTLTKIGGGAAGFDYSKIANNGSDLGAGVGLALGTNPADWACTRDNITGLTWEVKVNDETHLRHWNWQYTWHNSTGVNDGGNAGSVGSNTSCNSTLLFGLCNTEAFVTAVNAPPGLCGQTDWRMPTQRELLTLVYDGTQNPSIDATYFPNTVTGTGPIYWSGSSSANVGANAWFIDFDLNVSNAGSKAGLAHVRLVRGVQF